MSRSRRGTRRGVRRAYLGGGVRSHGGARPGRGRCLPWHRRPSGWGLGHLCSGTAAARFGRPHSRRVGRPHPRAATGRSRARESAPRSRVPVPARCRAALAVRRPPPAPRADRAAARERGAGPSTVTPKGAEGGATAPQARAARADASEGARAADRGAGEPPGGGRRASGSSPSVAAATISRLVKHGRVHRVDEGGYTVVETPTDDRSKAKAAGSEDGAAEPGRGVARAAPIRRTE
jgi:hypothetical protein